VERPLYYSPSNTSPRKTTPAENVLRALHPTCKKLVFHAFRRFRAETLRRGRVPENLAKPCLSHLKLSVTDFYARGRLEKDELRRREWCEPRQDWNSALIVAHKTSRRLVPRTLPKPIVGRE
jgi:hypothetical protein